MDGSVHADVGPTVDAVCCFNRAWELPALVLAESVRRTAAKDRHYRFFAVSRDPSPLIRKAAKRLNTRNFEFVSIPIPDAIWASTPEGQGGTKDANIRMRTQ